MTREAERPAVPGLEGSADVPVLRVAASHRSWVFRKYFANYDTYDGEVDGLKAILTAGMKKLDEDLSKSG